MALFCFNMLKKFTCVKRSWPPVSVFFFVLFVVPMSDQSAFLLRSWKRGDCDCWVPAAALQQSHRPRPATLWNVLFSPVGSVGTQIPERSNLTTRHHRIVKMTPQVHLLNILNKFESQVWRFLLWTQTERNEQSLHFHGSFILMKSINQKSLHKYYKLICMSLSKIVWSFVTKSLNECCAYWRSNGWMMLVVLSTCCIKKAIYHFMDLRVSAEEATIFNFSSEQ